MTNIEQAQKLFLSGGYTCVLCKDDITHTSTLSGITPMVEFITAGIDLNGFSAADKIVGKAAAMLFVLAGVKEIYASVMSEQALKVFLKYGVQYSYDTLTQTIVNHAGTGLCPMEQTVKDIENPSDAFEAIKHTLDFLNKKNKE
ncbi:MAG: DUF1893 domain-containing protein [Ignavibacteriales bacterium]